MSEPLDGRSAGFHLGQDGVSKASSSGSGPRSSGDWRTRWGEQKRPRTMSLTDTCWSILTAIATEQGINRSDVIEDLVRRAGSSVTSGRSDTEA